jgi:FAD/FMN-containing dehydrogenase
MSTVWSNWSGWVKAWPKEILTPESEDALARIVGEAAGPVRVAGRGHSFTAIVPSDDVLLSLEKMSDDPRSRPHAAR